MKKIAITGNKIDNYIHAYKSIGYNLIKVDSNINANDFNALIIAGGVDINPKYYNEDISGSKNIDDDLDKTQMILIDKFVQSKKPIFGICRGLQIINVYFGGSLCQDIENKDIHTGNNGIDKNHIITVSSHNFLEELYGKEFIVNSSHHQAVKKLGENLDILAYSKDGIVEAFKHTKLPIIAVQFHPERMTLDLRKNELVDGIKILKYFITML